MYNYYGIDIKTIPDGYEVKMRYNRINGKRGRVFLLFQMTVLTELYQTSDMNKLKQ